MGIVSLSAKCGTEAGVILLVIGECPYWHRGTAGFGRIGTSEGASADGRR